MEQVAMAIWLHDCGWGFLKQEEGPKVEVPNELVVVCLIVSYALGLFCIIRLIHSILKSF